MKALRVLPFLVIAAMAAMSACEMGRAPVIVPLSLAVGGPQTWVDAPLDQMHIPLAPYEVVFHGTDDGGVANVELRINDETVPASAQGSDPKLMTARYMWSPPAPGKYVLKARSMNSAGAWSPEAQVIVWVGDILTPSPMTTTPTATQTTTPVTPPPPATGPLTVTFLGASTGQFYFGGSSCGPNSVGLQVQVSDPAQIAGVTLFYKLRVKPEGAYTDWNSDLDLRSQGGGRFALDVSSRSINGIPSDDNWFIYQFIGTGPDHKPNSRSQVYGDISLTRCGGGVVQPGGITFVAPGVWPPGGIWPPPVVPEPTSPYQIVK